MDVLLESGAFLLDSTFVAVWRTGWEAVGLYLYSVRVNDQTNTAKSTEEMFLRRSSDLVVDSLQHVYH